MAYTVTIYTENGEYQVNKTFKTQRAAEAEMDEILANSDNLYGERITGACVSEE